MSNSFNRENVDVAWCPGCGNFGILKLVTEILAELEADKGSTVIVSGIGQAAKTPYYIDVNMFGVLHGRALPVATALKAANPQLTVIAEGGDGDMYGEGGNHFLHAIRRNVNIVHIVHNNMVYGLTKGQASPTSQKGFTSKVQVDGVGSEPFNPLSVALALKAGFVSRVNIGDIKHAKEILKAAFLHPGYALIDILQPCVVFNKTNTYKWFKDNSYILEDSHDSSNLSAAIQKVLEGTPMPLGIIYKNINSTFEQRVRFGSMEPLYAHHHDLAKIQEQFDSY
ncbi:MAG: 2-oxoglutarate ferredoxin oxidoreductase subunit beta [Sulfurimonas sp.]|jgi:2-oxoglutarate ferredoxin oxidoreductase subunit beta|uniref:thiamine pyrophosphate-dependent enzyme n=1 Tax=Sulfurimonas sp. TaxID=2022749 RepID=UPI0039E55847